MTARVLVALVKPTPGGLALLFERVTRQRVEPEEFRRLLARRAVPSPRPTPVGQRNV